jgi:hypothetical protein
VENVLQDQLTTAAALPTILFRFREPAWLITEGFSRPVPSPDRLAILVASLD